MFNLLKKRWLSWNLRRFKNGDPTAMNRLYRTKDPWGLSSQTEQFRFEETARIIRESIGNHFASVLEIGCGEGLQTKSLSLLSDRITGIDQSSHAIDRTRTLGISNATFTVGDLTSFRSKDPFTLVTACELMYYFEDEDFEEVYQSLSRLGESVMVTYYRGSYDRLDRFFSDKPVKFETIRGISSEWRVVWWHSQSPAVVANALLTIPAIAGSMVTEDSALFSI
jgi:SAM-dependent methyltransferase